MECTMAGQPPEPSFQPSGQEQGLTQGRPAWQQPAYPPPAGAPGGPQPGQGYPAPSFTPQESGYAQQDSGYAQQEPGYAPPDQGYAPQDQTYINLGQSAGYQAPGYAPAAGAGVPQWQGIAGVTPAGQPRQRGEKGFVGSLFDFSFTSMVTPKIIKVIYILLTIWIFLCAIGILAFFIDFGGWQGALAALIIVDPIFVLLSLGIYRVVLEAFMVVFRIYEEISERSANQA
jgi:hypothetical protein